MRSLRATIATLLATLALLAGCSDDKDPADPRSTWTPTSTPESPTTAATQAPVEPALPDAATKPTEAGARAFITYYWDLINYAQVTGDVKALKRASGGKCRGCNSGINGIENHYAAGGKIEGGNYTVEITKINELKDPRGAALAFEAKLSARNAKQRIINADGSVEVQSVGRSTLVVAALWAHDRWSLEAMETR